MRLDDVLRASELREGGETKHGRATCVLDLPEPRQDELELRRLDAVLVARRNGHATPRRAELDTLRGDLVENCELELGLDLHALVRWDELVVASERPDDRSSRCAAVEPLEPQPVREQVRNRRLQRIQPRQCVFANADQYVDA